MDVDNDNHGWACQKLAGTLVHFGVGRRARRARLANTAKNDGVVPEQIVRTANYPTSAANNLQMIFICLEWHEATLRTSRKLHSQSAPLQRFNAPISHPWEQLWDTQQTVTDR